ncbi:hypothetical protein Tco_1522261 [Tanacetum coccineum]
MARLPQDLIYINKMTDVLEPEESGVGGLQSPGKDRLQLVVVVLGGVSGYGTWREQGFQLMMYVDKVDQYGISRYPMRSGERMLSPSMWGSNGVVTPGLLIHADLSCTTAVFRHSVLSYSQQRPKLMFPISRVTPSSRNSRSGDHRCSRRDSPEYDRREGRVVSRYIVMIGIIEPFRYHHIFMDEDYKDCKQNDGSSIESFKEKSWV